MNHKTGKRLTMFFVSAILLSGLAWRLPARAAQSAPNFTLQSINGAQVSLDQFKGKEPVLIYFFATWCPHCQEMGPKVAKLRNSIPQSQLAILAIDVGSGDSLQKVKRYVADNHLPYQVLYDKGSQVTTSYGVVGIPYLILLDKSGAIKYQGYDLPPDIMSLVAPSSQKTTNQNGPQ